MDALVLAALQFDTVCAEAITPKAPNKVMSENARNRPLVRRNRLECMKEFIRRTGSIRYHPS
jgi:hypothetical protein